MLGGDQDLLDLDGAAAPVADGHLGLAVGAQIGQHLALADLGETPGEAMRERDRQWHELVGLVRRVAEHHPLIARPRDVERVVVGRVVASLVGGVDSLGDVGRLLVDRVDHRAGVAVEAVGGVVVADLANGLAGDPRDVDVGVGGDLPRDDDQAGVDEGFAGDPSIGVVRQDRIEDAVGDLIGDLVGMALRDRLGGEQELVVVELAHGLVLAPGRRGLGCAAEVYAARSRRRCPRSTKSITTGTPSMP